MKDNYGRKIDYLRISITDRCNLRCTYCMPEEGITCMSHDEILTYEEIEIICRMMAKIGLKHVKITGGEPLVRKECWRLIEKLKQVPGIETVTLTTNGILLEEMAERLVQAGVDGDDLVVLRDDGGVIDVAYGCAEDERVIVHPVVQLTAADGDTEHAFVLVYRLSAISELALFEHFKIPIRAKLRVHAEIFEVGLCY